MSEPTIEAEVVSTATERSERSDSSRKIGGRRKREPSATKLRAAALYASGKEKTLKGAIIAAGGSPNGVARVPGPKGWGSVALVRTDLEYNPAPTPAGEMLRDGFKTLHTLATRGESEAVRGGAADKLIGRLTDAGLAEDSNEITAALMFEAWREVRRARRSGHRAAMRLVARLGPRRAAEVQAEHERIEDERERRRTPAAAPAPAPHRYSTGPNE